MMHKPIEYYTLEELDHLFQDSRVGVSFSMIPISKGSLLGHVTLKGEI